MCFFRNAQAASQPHIKSGELRDSPLSPPRLGKLKLQEDVSSSADCLLEHDGGGNPQAGLSTPVLAPNIPKCMHLCLCILLGMYTVCMYIYIRKYTSIIFCTCVFPQGDK